jgi:exopolysaccharide production protein ExoQ
VNAQLAFLICAIGVAGLFFLDHDKSVRSSMGLWLSVIWLSINGSRPISVWLGVAGPSSGDALAATLEGSPLDAAIFELLIFAGIIVLFLRRRKTSALLKASGPVLIYYLYCLASTAWSPFPGPSFKRWIKCVGDLVMVLIVVTDAHPTTALRKLYSRVGFILLPLSIVLIKFTNLGVSYDEDGPHFTGVTLNKNLLGMTLYVISIGVVWNIRALLLDRHAPSRTRRLIAQSTLLIFGIVLLKWAHSATSTFCFTLGSGLLLASGLPIIRKRPGRLHALCFGILLLGAVAMLSGGGSVTSAMGRSSDFSGRTEIWAAAIASADSPLFGTGFESFWNKNSRKVVSILWNYSGIQNLNSAHDGYLQIYLDLGWIGVCLLSIILIVGYLRAIKAFRRDRELGSLFLACIVTAAFYNITEAGFRIMAPSWFSFLLAVVGATGVALGAARTEGQNIRALRSGKTRPATAVGGPHSEGQLVHRLQRKPDLI